MKTMVSKRGGIWVAVVAGVLACAVSGCGDDAQTVGDAGMDDAGSDASGCFDYQVEVIDWSSGNAVLPLTVTAEDEGLTATSAPNGRAVLCLDRDVRHRVRFEGTGYLPRVEVVSAADYLATVPDPNLAYQVTMLTQADLDGLGDAAATAGTAQLFVDLRAAGEPAADLTPVLDPSAGAALIGSAGGDFTPGTTTTDSDSVVHFRDAAAGSATLSPGSSELCGPDRELELRADEVTGVLIDCTL